MYTSNNYCFQATPNQAFPQVLGGIIGDTQFNCVEYYSTDDHLILGGTSKSTDIVNTANSALIIKLDAATGKLIWHSQIQTQSSDQVHPQSVIQAHVQDGQSPSYIIAVTSAPQFSVLIIDFSTGTLNSAYYQMDTSTSAVTTSLTPIGVFMDSSNNIYSLSQADNYVYLSSYAFTSGATEPTLMFSKIYGDSSNQEYGMASAILFSKNYVFISGAHNGSPIVILSSFTTGIPITNAIFSISGTSSSKGFSKIALNLNSVSNMAYLFLFGSFMGTSATDFVFLLISETSINGAGALVPNSSWYISQSTNVNCIAISLDDTYGAFIIAQQSIGKTYFGRVELVSSATSLSLTQLLLAPSASTISSYAGIVFGSSSSLYYAGQTLAIENLSYSKNQGFIMHWPQSGCVNTTRPGTTVSAAYQSTFASGDVTSLTTAIIYYASNSFQIYKISGASSSPLITTYATSIPSACSVSPSIGTIQATSISSQSYTVSSNSLTITAADFTYSQTCADTLTWTYTASLTDGSTLPSFISFTQNSAGNGFQFSVFSNDNINAGSYGIKISGSLNGAISSSTSFTLSVISFTSTSSTTSSTTTSTTTTSSTTTTTSSTTTTTTVTTTSTSSSSTTSSSSSTTTQTPSPSSSTDTTTESTSSSTTPSPVTTTSSTTITPETSTSSSTTSTTTPSPTTTTQVTSSSSSTTVAPTTPLFSSSTSTSTMTSQTTASSSSPATTLSAQTTTPAPITTYAPQTDLQSPRFSANPNIEIKIYAQSTSDYKLPAIINPNSLPVSIQMREQVSSSLPSFISVSKSTLRLTPNHSDIGRKPYVITLFYTDYPLYSSSYLMYIEVLPLQSKRNDNMPNTSTPIGGINNSTQALPITQSDVTIGSVDSNGVVTITFSQEALSMLNNSISADYFDIYTGDNKKYSKISDWNITVDEDGQVQVKVEFENSEEISMSQDQDYLTIEVGKKGTRRIKFSQRIPPQSNDIDYSQIKMESEIMYSLVQKTLLSSFAVSMIAGQSLQFMWGLINTLQLITHTPLFSIPYSLKILTFLKTFFYIATLDPFNSQPYLQRIFRMKDSDMYPEYNYRFGYLGYDNTNFIYLLGPPMFYIFYYLLMSVSYFFLSQLPKSLWKRTRVLGYIQRHLYFNGLICFFQETYLESGFSIIVCFLTSNFWDGSDAFNLLFALLFLLADAILLIYLPYYLKRFLEITEARTLKVYFSELAESISFKDIWSVLFYSVFMIRRMIFIVVVFIAENQLAIQIQTFILTNLLYLIYLIGVKPLKDTQNQEMINEISTLLISYSMLVFNDFVADIKPKQVFSNVFVGIYIGNIIINLLYVIFKSLSDIKEKMRLFLIKRKLKRLQLRVRSGQNAIEVGFLKNQKKNRKIVKIQRTENKAPELSVIKEEEDAYKEDIDVGFGYESSYSCYKNKFSYQKPSPTPKLDFRALQQQEAQNFSDFYRQENTRQSLIQQNASSVITEFQEENQEKRISTDNQSLNLPKSRFSLAKNQNQSDFEKGQDSSRRLAQNSQFGSPRRNDQDEIKIDLQEQDLEFTKRTSLNSYTIFVEDLAQNPITKLQNSALYHSSRYGTHRNSLNDIRLIQNLISPSAVNQRYNQSGNQLVPNFYGSGRVSNVSTSRNHSYNSHNVSVDLTEHQKIKPQSRRKGSSSQDRIQENAIRATHSIEIQPSGKMTD